MPSIKPVSDLRNYGEVLRDVAVGQPVFLTKNGHGRYAVLDMEEYREYERMPAMNWLLAELDKGRISGDAALRMIRRFQKAMLPLRDFPEMGSPLLTAGKQGAPYRYLVCGSYLIFYHIGAEAVHIDRVLYGRRDYMALLFGDKLEEE